MKNVAPQNFWLLGIQKFFYGLSVLCVIKWQRTSELAAFETITFTGTFGPLLWEKFYPVKGSEQTVEIDAQWLLKTTKCQLDFSLELSREIACGCCHAMVTNIATYLQPLLWAVLLLQPVLLVTSHCFCHFVIHYDLAHEGMASESDLLGSGSPSVCLMYRKRSITSHSLPLTHEFLSLMHHMLWRSLT